MRDKVLRAIARYDMLGSGDTVAVGLSGGADSTALLHVLCSLRESMGITVRAIHIHHGIRGEEADGDMRMCLSLCDRLNVPIDCIRLDVPAIARERGIGLEECGRQCRYEHFERISRQYGCKIATAHTLSDSVETVLLNITRGCGTAGLRGIPPVRGNIIRPLIMAARGDIERYCAENDLLFATDSTNCDTAYSRNRIRCNVIPELARINPSLLSAVERLTASASEDDDCLTSMARDALTAARTDGGYRISDIAPLHPALRHRVLIAAAQDFGITPERRHIGLMEDCVIRGSGAVELCGGITASVSDGLLRIGERHEDTPQQRWSVPLTLPETTLPGGAFLRFDVISREIYDEKVKNDKYLFKNTADYDIISFNPDVRNRREGDMYRQAGRGIAKKVKKLFCEAHIPAEKRAELAIIEAHGDIAWIEGFGVAEAFRVTAETKQVLVIRKDTGYIKD